MSIEVHKIKGVEKDEIIAFQILIDSKESWKLFQQLVNRATNCWDTAPPEIKEFADKVTEGKVLQNYRDQSNITRTEDLPKL